MSYRLDKYILLVFLTITLAFGLLIYSYDYQGIKSARGDKAGVLSKSSGLVRKKSRDSVDWNKTNQGDIFFENDFIYTDNESFAEIRLETGAEIQLGPNSGLKIKLESDTKQFIVEGRTITFKGLEKGNYLINKNGSEIELKVETGTGYISIDENNEIQGTENVISSSQIITKFVPPEQSFKILNKKSIYFEDSVIHFKLENIDSDQILIFSSSTNEVIKTIDIDNSSTFVSNLPPDNYIARLEGKTDLVHYFDGIDFIVVQRDPPVLEFTHPDTSFWISDDPQSISLKLSTQEFVDQASLVLNHTLSEAKAYDVLNKNFIRIKIEEPGEFELNAKYRYLDGKILTSNTLRYTVRRLDDFIISPNFEEALNNQFKIEFSLKPELLTYKIYDMMKTKLIGQGNISNHSVNISLPNLDQVYIIEFYHGLDRLAVRKFSVISSGIKLISPDNNIQVKTNTEVKFTWTPHNLRSQVNYQLVIEDIASSSPFQKIISTNQTEATLKIPNTDALKWYVTTDNKEQNIVSESRTISIQRTTPKIDQTLPAPEVRDYVIE